MKITGRVKPGPWSGNKHPLTSSADMPSPKPGTRRVEIPLHATCSGVTAKMPVTLPAWPEGWGAEDGGSL